MNDEFKSLCFNLHHIYIKSKIRTNAVKDILVNFLRPYTRHYNSSLIHSYLVFIQFVRI